ncbi:uncharacterized protein ABDE67_009274 [Symphorus nematophorus]
MRHLVRMASYSSETNMHARNLAIVWAPNLLRSKDIEASGFNGTAAFMEVRVQSIVVEFILTHVPQLFPEQGVSNERRNSLPSPTAASSREEGLCKSTPTAVPNFGNISPGDGPLAIRPYHAIIEGTDKRKGSLKGRKWMSIFNIGGRFHDPRRRHKHSAKEKDRPALRPARSMDSLSTPSFPNEGCRRPAQRPPSTNMPSSPKPGSDVAISSGAIGGSEYAVTYRRGTGLVSGGAGTQGTYTALDPEGLGVAGGETLQSRSPGLSSKVGKRAAMHITGPTMVTVPLHITSNLALGVLQVQGGGGDRVIHRGRDKDGGDRVEGKEGGEKVERRKRKVEECRKVEEEKNHREKVTDRDGVVDAEVKTAAGAGGEEEEGEGKKEEKEKEEVRDEGERKPDVVTGGRGVSRDQRAKSLTTNTEEDDDEDAVIDDKDVDENSEYMEMKGMHSADFQSEEARCADDHELEASDVLNSTEVEGDDLGLSGYVQDNFEFLDQMDCSVLDHMDCSVSYQVNEFSVEPPGHSDDEYEVMEQAQPPHPPAEPQTHLQPGPEAHTQSPTELKPHRPLSLDLQSRHTKSLSLPYMTSPVRGPDESSSEEEVAEDDSDDEDYSSEDDDDNMFVKSLPPDFFLNNLSGLELETDGHDGYAPDGVPDHQSHTSEEKERQSMNSEFPACKESIVGDPEQVDRQDKEDEDELEEKELTKREEEDENQQERDQSENNGQSKATEEDAQSDKEQPLTPETHCCAEFPLPSSDGSSTMADVAVKEERKVADDSHGGYPPCRTVSLATETETADVPSEEFRDVSVGATEQPGSCEDRDSDEGEDRKVSKETEDKSQEMVLEIKENDENTCEETTEEGNKVIADIKHEEEMQESGTEQDSAICRTSDAIWDELEEVICEVIEDEERKQAEKNGVAREGDAIEDGKVEEEEEQIAKVSGEKMVEGETNETEVRLEMVEETTEEKLAEPEMQQETNLPKKHELDDTIQGKHAINDKAQHHGREEVVSKEKQNNDEQRRTPPSIDNQLKEVRSDMKELKESRKCEESDDSRGGVGRKLVVSKRPKVYQVKAVPVVPPKPQHCKITALTLRQQEQERERRENSPKVPTEQDRVWAGEQGKDDGDDGDEGDGDESATVWDTSRNSPLSMCFDEAVAIATMRREKEKECEKEKERQREWGNEVQ